ncbi:MAG: DUF5011 domain-containing protein, partial [Bacilli bacterium]|nr:DUF5011 domain-containing protein [Bacilli bacterium]
MKKISMILPLLFTLLIVLSGCDKHDTTPPTIMLSGADLITIEVGEPYQELGATCIDDIDKTCQVTIDDTFLEVDRVGVYQIVYEAMDLSKNAAKSITRTVEVIDTTSPVIEIIGNSVIYHEVTESYHDLGAICVDNYDTNCSVTIDDSNLFIDIIGSYEVIYTASDSSSNEAIQVVRTV